MSLSTRHSITWETTAEDEPTSTLVITSPLGKYVDIRSLLPISNGKLEWYFAGCERELEPAKNGNCRLEFTHTFFDSTYIKKITELKSKNINCKIPKIESFVQADQGEFFDTPNPWERARGIRYEAGEMLNANSGKIEEYLEKWISLDPSSAEIVHLKNDTNTNLKVNCLVLDTVGGGSNGENKNKFIGRLILYGKWYQAVLWDRESSLQGHDEQQSVGVIRSVKSVDDLSFEKIIEYGGQACKLPQINEISALTQAVVGDILSFNEINWEVVEVFYWDTKSKL